MNQIRIKTKGTKEWSDCSYNIMNGCKYNCVYCYARNMDRRFRREKMYGLKSEFPKIPKAKTVMFPTAHDIDEAFIEHFQTTILNLYGDLNEILIVTKAGKNTIKQIFDYINKFPNAFDIYSKIEVRHTITTLCENVRSKFECNAPSIEDRLEALELSAKYCRNSVSIEPMLCYSPKHLDLLIEKIFEKSPNTTIWIGALSFVPKEMRDFVSKYYTQKNFSQIFQKYGTHPQIKFKDTFLGWLEKFEEKEKNIHKQLEDFHEDNYR